MPHYTQLYCQLVFAVRGRRSLIGESWEGQLYAYMSGLIQKRKHTVITINGMPDHIHILLDLHPEQAISDLVRDIKSNSSRFVNEQGLASRAFRWQSAYAALTYSRSQVPKVKRYIECQKEHHAKRSFKQEMQAIFEKVGITNSEEYGFSWEFTD